MTKIINFEFTSLIVIGDTCYLKISYVSILAFM